MSARPIWWALLVVAVTACTAAILIHPLVTADTVVVPAFLSYGVVGALISRRRPESALGWVFLAIGVAVSLAMLAGAATAGAATRPAGTSLGPVVVLAAWYQSWYWMPLIFLSTTITVLIFPTVPTRRLWQRVLGVALVALVVMTVVAATAPTVPLNVEGSVVMDNPLWIGLPGSLWAIGTPFFVALVIVEIACGLLRAGGMVVDFRRARGVERMQLRWFAWAVALFAPLWLIAMATAESQPVLSEALNLICLALVPAACFVAVLRYRLYDIDRVVSRSMSYAVVTGVVLATYAMIVTAASSLLGEASTVAVAGATLAAAALVRPALTRVQRAVDRRFDREKVDAQREVDAFGARLADAVDGASTSTELVAVTRRTLAPSTITLWTVHG